MKRNHEVTITIDMLKNEEFNSISELVETVERMQEDDVVLEGTISLIETNITESDLASFGMYVLNELLLNVVDNMSE